MGQSRAENLSPGGPQDFVDKLLMELPVGDLQRAQIE
jgi:hypothetical protein